VKNDAGVKTLCVLPKNLLQFPCALLETTMSAIGAGKKILFFVERIPLGRVGSSRPKSRINFVKE
jgi:hypothetical protein